MNEPKKSHRIWKEVLLPMVPIPTSNYAEAAKFCEGFKRLPQARPVSLQCFCLECGQSRLSNHEHNFSRTVVICPSENLLSLPSLKLVETDSDREVHSRALPVRIVLARIGMERTDVDRIRYECVECRSELTYVGLDAIAHPSGTCSLNGKILRAPQLSIIDIPYEKRATYEYDTKVESWYAYWGDGPFRRCQRALNSEKEAAQYTEWMRKGLITVWGGEEEEIKVKAQLARAVNE